MKIDKEFKKLIPPLSDEEYAQLEANILRDGIRDSLVVWNDGADWILIDGHNRWEIAQKHDLPYNQRRMEFPNREAVKEWIIRNQLGRRNIPMYVRAELALKLKPEIEQRAKENLHQGNKPLQNSVNPVNTQKEIAKAAGVSHDTIHKVEKIQEKASEEAKEALRKGETSINQVYTNLIAAENENRKQQEARELREAKKRTESFDEQKSNGIIELDAAKQNKEDQELIAENFIEEFDKMVQHVRRFAAMVSDGRFEKSLKCADKYEARAVMSHLQECYRSIMKMQRVTEEVIKL